MERLVLIICFLIKIITSLYVLIVHSLNMYIKLFALLFVLLLLFFLVSLKNACLYTIYNSQFNFMIISVKFMLCIVYLL